MKNKKEIISILVVLSVWLVATSEMWVEARIDRIVEETEIYSSELEEIEEASESIAFINSIEDEEVEVEDSSADVETLSSEIERYFARAERWADRTQALCFDEDVDEVLSMVEEESNEIVQEAQDLQ